MTGGTGSGLKEKASEECEWNRDCKEKQRNDFSSEKTEQNASAIEGGIESLVVVGEGHARPQEFCRGGGSQFL